ncbi:MAG: hypothetical protein AVDCRST_MAG07-12, partial [uncultured Frankineae bacterium]
GHVGAGRRVCGDHDDRRAVDRGAAGPAVARGPSVRGGPVGPSSHDGRAAAPRTAVPGCCRAVPRGPREDPV